MVRIAMEAEIGSVKVETVRSEGSYCESVLIMHGSVSLSINVGLAMNDEWTLVLIALHYQSLNKYNRTSVPQCCGRSMILQVHNSVQSFMHPYSDIAANASADKPTNR